MKFLQLNICRAGIIMISLSCFSLSETGCSNSKNENGNSESSAIEENTFNRPQITAGKKLFRDSCNRCHGLGKADNAFERTVEYLDKSYFIQFTRNQDSLLKANDKYAVELKKMYGNSSFTHHYQLTDEQIKAIISFLEAYPDI